MTDGLAGIGLERFGIKTFRLRFSQLQRWFENPWTPSCCWEGEEQNLYGFGYGGGRNLNLILESFGRKKGAPTWSSCGCRRRRWPALGRSVVGDQFWVGSAATGGRDRWLGSRPVGKYKENWEKPPYGTWTITKCKFWYLNFQKEHGGTWTMPLLAIIVPAVKYSVKCMWHFNIVYFYFLINNKIIYMVINCIKNIKIGNK